MIRKSRLLDPIKKEGEEALPPINKGKIKFAGRPRKFGTPKKLEEAILSYFEETQFNRWTVSGLALVIGSKQLLLDYEKRKGFEFIVKQAKLMIEDSYEQTLREEGGSHNIFALKNFGWKDRNETDITSNGKSFTSLLTADLNKMDRIEQPNEDPAE